MMKLIQLGFPVTLIFKSPLLPFISPEMIFSGGKADATAARQVSPQHLKNNNKNASTDGTPDHRNSTPGVTRPGSECPIQEVPITALLGKIGRDFTVSEYPSFWFYIPYATNEIKSMEFLLLDGRERKTIYRTKVELTQQPRFIQITIPSNPQYSLQVGENYRWYFKLACEPNNTFEPDLVVDGWIQRRDINPEIENQLQANPLDYTIYQENDIWYDTIANLTKLYFANPESQEIKYAWTSLLENLGFSNLSDKAFANSELIP